MRKYTLYFIIIGIFWKIKMLQPRILSVTRTENRTCIRNFGLSRTLSINNYHMEHQVHSIDQKWSHSKGIRPNSAFFAIIFPRRHRDRRRISRCLGAYLDVRAHQVYHKIRTCLVMYMYCYRVGVLIYLIVKYFPWFFFYLFIFFLFYI